VCRFGLEDILDSHRQGQRSGKEQWFNGESCEQEGVYHKKNMCTFQEIINFFSLDSFTRQKATHWPKRHPDRRGSREALPDIEVRLVK
jgi:glycogen synthase